jgi:hypothetical protein
MNAMNAADTTDVTDDPRDMRIKRWLLLAWFAIFPAFTLLVARTLYERAVLRLPELWPWLKQRPTAAFLAGAIYVSAHWWCLAWYLLAVRRTQRPVPTMAQLVDECRPYLPIVIAMLLILAIEYSPITIWRLLAR